MEQPTQVQIIEIFHLLFLQTLSARSQEWFVLKGGANIRYFFDSHRYSNDIDLDFVNKEGWSVEQSVDKVLSGAALTMLLRRERIEVVELSKPKQTEMTRRWKIGLGRTGFPGPPVRTKIEFSQRPGASDDVLAERIPDFVVAPYGIMSIVVRHYGLTAAIEQKIAALALRSETKARDVFDLDLLLRRRDASANEGHLLKSEFASAAGKRAREIPYSSFQSEVLPFFEPDIVPLYDSEEIWRHMADSVAERLQQIADDDSNAGAS